MIAAPHLIVVVEDDVIDDTSNAIPERAPCGPRLDGGGNIIAKLARDIGEMAEARVQLLLDMPDSVGKYSLLHSLTVDFLDTVKSYGKTYVSDL